MSTSDFVRVSVNCSAHLPAIKSFPRDISIHDLANKLELMTGVTGEDTKISLTVDDRLVSENIFTPEGKTRTLDSFLPPEFSTVSIEVTGSSDLDSSLNGDAAKFTLDAESYASRAETARKFLEEKKLQDTQAKFPVGATCEVTVAGHPVRKGTIMYVGNTEFKPGVWIGVQYEEPLGKNDGSVAGKRYFTCPQLHGGFVKPGDVMVIQ